VGVGRRMCGNGWFERAKLPARGRRNHTGPTASVYSGPTRDASDDAGATHLNASREGQRR